MVEKQDYSPAADQPPMTWRIARLPSVREFCRVRQKTRRPRRKKPNPVRGLAGAGRAEQGTPRAVRYDAPISWRRAVLAVASAHRPVPRPRCRALRTQASSRYGASCRQAPAGACPASRTACSFSSTFGQPGFMPSRALRPIGESRSNPSSISLRRAPSLSGMSSHVIVVSRVPVAKRYCRIRSCSAWSASQARFPHGPISRLS